MNEAVPEAESWYVPMQVGHLRAFMRSVPTPKAVHGGTPDNASDRAEQALAPALLSSMHDDSESEARGWGLNELWRSFNELLLAAHRQRAISGEEA